MAKCQQEKRQQICEHMPEKVRNRIGKHYDAKGCPLCRYQQKRAAMFMEHLKKVDGLISIEACRVEKTEKTTLVGDDSRALAVDNFSQSITPTMQLATNDEVGSLYYDSTYQTKLPLSPARSFEITQTNNAFTHHHAEHTEDEQPPTILDDVARHSLAETSSYPYPPPLTPTSQDTNLEESIEYNEDDGIIPRSDQDGSIEDNSPIQTSFFKEESLDWEADWQQWDRWDMRAAFEGNQGLHEVSLGLLLGVDPLGL